LSRRAATALIQEWQRRAISCGRVTAAPWRSRPIRSRGYILYSAHIDRRISRNVTYGEIWR